MMGSPPSSSRLKAGQAASAAFRRRLAGWLVCLLATTNFAFPPVSPFGPASPEFVRFLPAQLASGQPFDICTANGLVVIDTTGKPIQDRHPGSGFCVFCLPLLHGSMALPASGAVVLAFGPLLGSLAPLHRDNDAVQTCPFILSFPRAPPEI
jgi:hypothetical protein